MNGYFQLTMDAKGVSIKLCPPTGDGEKIRVAELKEYLERVGVPFDPMAVNAALYQLQDKEIVLFLHPVKIREVDERFNLIVAQDKLSAAIRMYPASEGGAALTKNEIMNTLKSANVKYGIDEAAIDKALSEKVYCTDIIVAKGKAPTAGRDAEIKYYFETNNDARPELNEDGTVDFFKLNTLHHCVAGQVLAEIIPEIQGEDGVDVYGSVSKAREVKKAKFDHGRNLEFSEDGLKLASMVDGHAMLVDGAVFVSDVYSVENVGTSTGNIEYHGNVEVGGNVCENFSIKTDGSVFVSGVVEGAVIEAGGDIIIARGMHGQNKGILRAGGNIIAKFISAVDVQADGFVEAEQILNSKVIAGTSVNAEAGKGLITGGRIIAKNAVNAKNIGSAMGTSTIVEVGSDPEAKKRLAMLQKSVGEKSKSLVQMKKVLEATMIKIKSGEKLLPEQLKNAKMLQTTLVEQQTQLQEEMKEIETLDKALRGDDNAHIDIRGTMYQGCSVGISGATMTVKSEYTFCRLVKKGADVASTNL